MSPHIAVLLTWNLLAGATFGDWVVSRPNGTQIAETTNDAGAGVGVLCRTDTKSCIAFVLTTNECTDGDRIPMMLNSRVGAGGITTICRHLPTDETGTAVAINVVEDFATMKQAFESGDTIGIAMPMANGAFLVHRFSTAGATAAIEQAMTQPAKDMSAL